MIGAELFGVVLGYPSDDLIKAGHQRPARRDLDAARVLLHAPVVLLGEIIDRAQAAVGQLLNGFFEHGVVIKGAAEHTRRGVVEYALIGLGERQEHRLSRGLLDREAQRLRDVFELAERLLFDTLDKLLQLQILFKRDPRSALCSVNRLISGVVLPDHFLVDAVDLPRRQSQRVPDPLFDRALALAQLIEPGLLSALSS